MRRISVFGATGSIGQTTLEVISAADEAVQIQVLSAHDRVQELAALARRYQAKYAVIAKPEHYQTLKESLAGTPTIPLAGEQGLREAAAVPADWTMMAMAGATALPVTLEIAKKGGVLALANKESIVCGGPWFLAQAQKWGCVVLPVDSEHNALFQILGALEIEKSLDDRGIESITITASGGPFRDRPLHELSSVTPEEAARHPVWPMGRKISIDSATLMNKGLEMIEAAYLFKVPAESIHVLIHPQSLIHAFVSYKDGSTLAHLAEPHMRIPISHTFSYPKRSHVLDKKLSLTGLNKMTFLEVDPARFPAVSLARSVIQAERSASVVFNAANEEAVSAFCDGKIPFTQIVAVVEKVLSRGSLKVITSLEDILEVDHQARRVALDMISEESAARSVPAPRATATGI